MVSLIFTIISAFASLRFIDKAPPILLDTFSNVFSKSSVGTGILNILSTYPNGVGSNLSTYLIIPFISLIASLNACCVFVHFFAFFTTIFSLFTFSICVSFLFPSLLAISLLESKKPPFSLGCSSPVSFIWAPYSYACVNDMVENPDVSSDNAFSYFIGSPTNGP